MILGLDVGGTQTDAVLIEGAEIVAKSKTPTRENLLETLREALDQTLSRVEAKSIERAAFSTTLATNAIVQDRLEKTGMIISAGPGIDPALFFRWGLLIMWCRDVWITRDLKRRPFINGTYWKPRHEFTRKAFRRWGLSASFPFEIRLTNTR